MKNFLYQQIADKLQAQIASGFLTPGHKLPSVRVFCKQHQVSPSTIFSAYYRLEAMGLIEARPKSGYYVKNSQTLLRMRKYKEALPLPKKTSKPVALTASDIIDEIEMLNQQPNVTTFAQATPTIEMLPHQKLKKSVNEVMKNQPDQWLNYTHPQGVAELRTQILLHTIKWGFRGNEQDILITAGCLEALSLCLQSVTQPGDLIVSEDLTYFGIQQLIENLGLKVIPIASHPETGFDLDYLEQLLEQHPVKACLFTSNFHNPTAHSIPDAQKQQLAALACRQQVPMIEDDVYGEIYFGKQRPATIKRFDAEGWVMYCTSFSKMLSPGYRLGYCLPGRFKNQVFRQKRIHSLSVNSLAQHALSNFLQKGRFDYHLKKLRNDLYFQMLKYEQCIVEHFPKETYFIRPQGGYVFWIGFEQQIDTYQLYLKAKANNISISPGHIFSLNGQYKNFIRLSFANFFNEKTEKALHTLGKLVHGLGV